MRLKLFRAAGMAEAMASIRAELGAEALILSSRRVGNAVEVTAALQPEEDEAPPPLTVMAHRATSPGALCVAPASDKQRAALRYHAVPPSLVDALAGGALAERLASALAFATLPLSPGGRPLLFTGPPGAGKTLTVARLATRLVMQGTPPMVITADGRRAGATEQLAAFTRLLGISLIVASHPATLARALARRRGGEPVLIDAPGMDAFDPTQLEELAALAAAADARPVLVLAAGLDPAEAADLAGAFATALPTGETSPLVATRLDLARRLGAILAAATHGSFALAEAGIGPGAADGLVPLTPGFLAERLLAAAAPHRNTLP
jgi:flagellar biosynthesis protein FlhF